jgi:hypothetical protein
VTQVKNALADPTSDIFAAVRTALSNDLGGVSGDATASLYYANTFENVAIESQDLVVEYTASWPERVRYYALFARADGSATKCRTEAFSSSCNPDRRSPTA